MKIRISILGETIIPRHLTTFGDCHTSGGVESAISHALSKMNRRIYLDDSVNLKFSESRKVFYGAVIWSGNCSLYYQ